MTAYRRVEAEILDVLAADDPRARRSRRDLKRVHWAMRSIAGLRRAIAGLDLASPPRRILELGAGDGTLLLRFARAQAPRWPDVELTLLDRIDVVSAETRAAYRDLGWRVTLVRADVLEWAREPSPEEYDLCFANLFLHHFAAPELARLLRAVAALTPAFVACEPRRSRVAHWGSRLIACLGVNAVTREDAVTSVAAGFTDQELTAAWGANSQVWRTREYPLLPFMHCFTAARAMHCAPQNP